MKLINTVSSTETENVPGVTHLENDFFNLPTVYLLLQLLDIRLLWRHTVFDHVITPMASAPNSV